MRSGTGQSLKSDRELKVATSISCLQHGTAPGSARALLTVGCWSGAGLKRRSPGCVITYYTFTSHWLSPGIKEVFISKCVFFKCFVKPGQWGSVAHNNLSQSKTNLTWNKNVWLWAHKKVKSIRQIKFESISTIGLNILSMIHFRVEFYRINPLSIDECVQ